MSFSPQLFLANIKAKDGLARPCRYEVILPIPTAINEFVSSSLMEKILNAPNAFFTDITDAVRNLFGTGGSPQDIQSQTSNAAMSRYLALQCEAAELPGRAIQTADVKIYGPTFKVPFQTQFQNGETTLTFLCTNEFYERKLFDTWLECIMPLDTNNLRYAKGESTRYLTNIKIIQYDDFIKQIYAVELIDAFPTSISSQPLSWTDDGFHRVTVQFAFQKTRIVYDGQYDLAAAATALFGVAGSRLFDKAQSSIANAIGKIIF
jgi:hypothetical protein